jgi:uncharacterized membrane protein
MQGRRVRRRTRAAAVAALALLALATGCIKDLGFPGPYNGVTVGGVSPTGAVVGTSYDFDFNGNSSALGYIYENGAYTSIGQPVQGGGTGAVAVNSSGTVAGCRLSSAGTEPILWTRAGGIVPISIGAATPGTCPEAMNEAGEVILNPFGALETGTGYLWRPSGAPVELRPVDGLPWTRAEDINNAGQVVGRAAGPNGVTAPVVWGPPLYEPQRLPTAGGAGGEAIIIDQDGTVLGFVDGTSAVTRWEPTAGRPSTTFTGISPTDMDGGVIVGIIRDDDNVDHAAAWMPGAPAPKLLSSFGGSSQALAISGRIVVGLAYVPDAGTHVVRFTLP